jgi:4-nitrophenyl phosphatase
MQNLKINAFIIDMDGVIWRKDQPIGDLAAIFQKISDHGINYVFATNNATNSTDTYHNLLRGFGVPVEKEQIVTSATATAQYLKQEHPGGGNIYVVGVDGLETTLEEYGFNISEDQPLAVVTAMDPTLTYQKLKTATLLIRQGVPFIGTNPDRTFPSPEGLVPGAGSILAAIEAATNVQPEIIGKPKATMFLQALDYLGEDAKNVLVIGDRLETDIAGGQAAMCRTGVVLTGVSTLEMAEAWEPAIDIIAEDLDHLVSILGGT